STHGSDPSTAPVRRIAFGSCANQNKPQPIWDSIVGLKPDLFLFLGDNIYADTNDMEVMKRKYELFGANPGFQQLKQTCKILATWDDHDYGKNDAGYEYGPKKESQKLFLDFFGVADDSPRRQQDGVYHSETFGPPGQRVQIIMLDTRTFRSPLKKKDSKPASGEGPYISDDSEDCEMLGEAQWKWLEEQLQQPADIRIVGSSIQVLAQDHGWEKWHNHSKQREKLFQLIESTQAKGVIFLSGDRHLAELSMMPKAVSYPLYDLTSSGLTEAFKRFRPLEVNQHRVATMNWGNNFGFITIDWYASDPVIRLQIRDEAGEVTIQQKVLLSTINPTRRLPDSSSSISAEPEKTSPGTINTVEAAQKVGEEVTVEFRVQATGGSGSRIFLNSLADFRDSRNFTVVLEKGYLTKTKDIEDHREFFKGKKIQVKGKVETYRDAPQIKVTDPEQIKLAP
ncbi:MAG TPA: alkaline phosphatase D family protein, partial [Gemmatales bacterium]|nr:alkaline phosphatase D family protein [Gemmatales bacterium]